MILCEIAYSRATIVALFSLCVFELVHAQPVDRIFDNLEVKLIEIDALMDGPENTPFDEVNRRCIALLSEFPKPEEQARIYYMWAYVEGQSGLRHPKELIERAEKALALPLASDKRLQLQMYMGNSLEVLNRGATGDALAKVRPEIAAIYVQALNECARYLAEAEQIPLPAAPPIEVPGQRPRANNRARTVQKSAENRKSMYIKRLQGFQTAFEKQIAFLYSRRPFASDEIEMLIAKYVSDQSARGRIMANVAVDITKRESETQGSKLTNQPLGQTSNKWLIGGNVLLIIVIIVIIVIRKRIWNSGGVEN